MVPEKPCFLILAQIKQDGTADSNGETMDPSMNFEDALKRLEEIVKELENGDIDIEKALTLFEEGTRLSKVCAKKLSKIERRVEILTKGENGENVLELFQDIDNE